MATTCSISSQPICTARIALLRRNCASKTALRNIQTVPSPAPHSRSLLRTGNVRKLWVASSQVDSAPQPAVIVRDDDVLPDSLYDAVIQSGTSTAAAIQNGTQETLVEILVPELWDQTSGNIMREEGDQQRIWELTRFFVECLIEQLGLEGEEKKSVRAIYPDAGVAALLSARWPDAPFTISSLNDRSLVKPGDRVCVVCAPDPQGVEESEKVATKASEVGAALVLINPRLASGDAGIGLNVRRMKERFLSRLTVTYSLRPMGTGTVFRRFPGPYQVFIEDSNEPGRYKLIHESIVRVAGEELMDLMDSAAGRPAIAGDDDSGTPPQQEGVVENLTKTVKSMMRFMNSLK